jgi:hypothetical protein
MVEPKWIADDERLASLAAKDARIATLESQLRQTRELVERAFRDGVAYATICEVVDVDLAWETSAVRSVLTALQGEGK